jgi:hypothetical protein
MKKQALKKLKLNKSKVVELTNESKELVKGGWTRVCASQIPFGDCYEL